MLRSMSTQAVLEELRQQNAAQAAQTADEAYDKFVTGATADEVAYAKALSDRFSAQAEAAGQKQLYLQKQDNQDYIELLGQVQSGETKLMDLEDELDNRRHERALQASGIQDDLLGKLMDEYQIGKELIDQNDVMMKAYDDQQKALDDLGKFGGTVFDELGKCISTVSDELADEFSTLLVEALS